MPRDTNSKAELTSAVVQCSEEGNLSHTGNPLQWGRREGQRMLLCRELGRKWNVKRLHRGGKHRAGCRLDCH